MRLELTRKDLLVQLTNHTLLEAPRPARVIY